MMDDFEVITFNKKIKFTIYDFVVKDHDTIYIHGAMDIIKLRCKKETTS